MVTVESESLFIVAALVVNAMEDLNEVQEEFNSVEGIEANSPGGSAERRRVLVKVTDESAVGRFYGKARELDVELSAVTRNHLAHTVLDAWASFSSDD